MKRLCLYLIADKDGIIDEYICYLLKHIRRDVSDIFVISNGYLKDDGIKKISRYVQDVYIRENEGFDAGGFKDAIMNYISFERIRQYDELILINDSFFGPISSFTHVFNRMSARKDIDFWSLTKNMGNAQIPQSMQTYFVVFKDKCLHSNAFEKFWISLPYYTTFTDVVEQYEKNFAQFFVERGFRWDSYIDDTKYECGIPREYCFSSYHSEQYELMREQEYPVVKRKLFAFDAMETDYGIERQGRENIIETLKYIDERTTYDINLIWKHILRVYDLRSIQDSCCLRYILPYGELKHNAVTKSVMCIWHRGSKLSFEMKMRLPDIVKNADVVILSDCEINEELKGVKHIILSGVKDKWSALIAIKELLKQYDFIGVLSDDIFQATATMPYSMKSGEAWTKWENMVGHEEFIKNVINALIDKHSLGLLVAQRPVFAEYFTAGALSETIDSQPSEFFDLARYLKVKDKIKSKYLAEYADSFWCKGELLLEFIDRLGSCERWIVNKGKVIDKLFPYFVQTKGLYTATVETDKSSAVTETLCIDYLRDIVNENKRGYIFKTYPDMKGHVSNPIKNIEEVRKFIGLHKNVGIYGAGKIARQLVILNDIKEFDYFIVSDGEAKKTILEGKDVICVSEIKDKDIDGIIIALNQKNTHAALIALGKYNYDNDIMYVMR